MNESIEPYKDAYGMVSPRRTVPGETDPSGNGLYYSALWLYVLYKCKRLTETDRKNWLKILSSCEDAPGLLDRSPTELKERDQTGWDDYVGAVLAGYVLTDSSFSHRFLMHGRKGFTLIRGVKLPYYYDNASSLAFHPKAFLGRYQQLIFVAQIVAGEKPPFWRSLWFSVALVMNSLKGRGNESGKILNRVLIEVGGRYNWLTRLASDVWSRMLLRRYPMGMYQVLRIYFGADHPIAKYWID